MTKSLNMVWMVVYIKYTLNMYSYVTDTCLTFNIYIKLLQIHFIYKTKCVSQISNISILVKLNLCLKYQNLEFKVIPWKRHLGSP